MTTTTITKKIELLRLDISGNELVPAEAVREFIELKTTLETQIKATMKALESYMIDNGIKNLDCLTIAERRSWKATKVLPPRFYKQVLDTTRLNFMLEHGDTIPAGATYTTGSYITKTNRKAEAQS